MGILNWGFRANLKLYQAESENSIDLPLKNGSEKSIKFADFVQDKLPIIDTSKKLWLNPLLFNGSLQTLYYTSSDSSRKFLIYYGRELFTYKDGGICSLDWVIPKPQSKEEFKELYEKTLPEGAPKLHPRSRYFTEGELEKLRTLNQGGSVPIVVILHGLAGGSHEPLIRNLAEYISDRTNQTWDTVVINSRGCCRTKITTGKLFNALSTDDIKEVLIELKKRFPKRPVYAVGFSFGAAMLANYLGETDKIRGQDDLVKAACLIGCPWDLVDSAYYIDSSWTGKYLLNPALAKFLNKIVKNNYKELNLHNPALFNEESLATANNQTKTWQFDSVYTCHTAGFSNPFEYYREASPARRLKNIKIPTLSLNSTDDPAVGVRLPWLDIKSNPYLSLIETDLGGHLGYVKSSGEFWCVEVVEEFFTKFEELIK